MKWLLASLCVVGLAVRGAADDAVLEAKGYVVAAHPVQVSPTVAGVLVWVDPRFEEGQAFKEGDVLARIDDREYRCDVERAESALHAAEARLAALQSAGPEEVKQAEAELDEARANYEEIQKTADRVAALKERVAVSQQDYDAALAAAAGAKRKVSRCESALERAKKGPRLAQDAAEAEAQVARADLEKAKLRLAACEVRAPIAGVILAKHADRGDYVNPLALNANGLCEMADLSDLEVEVKFQERDILRVSKDQPCTALPEAYQNDRDFLKAHPHGYDGKGVARIVPSGRPLAGRHSRARPAERAAGGGRRLPPAGDGRRRVVPEAREALTPSERPPCPRRPATSATCSPCT